MMQGTYAATAIWPPESGKPVMVAVRRICLEPRRGVVVLIWPGEVVDAASLVAWAYPESFRPLPEVVQ